MHSASVTKASIVFMLFMLQSVVVCVVVDVVVADDNVDLLFTVDRHHNRTFDPVSDC